MRRMEHRERFGILIWIIPVRILQTSVTFNKMQSERKPEYQLSASRFFALYVVFFTLLKKNFFFGTTSRICAAFVPHFCRIFAEFELCEGFHGRRFLRCWFISLSPFSRWLATVQEALSVHPSVALLRLGSTSWKVNRSPRGNTWSAIPVALLCMIFNLSEGKQSSGPKGDNVK